jgi:anthranilate/para-aminobenzoate synthase component I
MNGALTAALLRHGMDDCVYLFDEPEYRLRGSWRDWDLLDAELRKRCRGGANNEFHPPGAAVGYFTYEGDFDFAFYPQLRVASAREFLGERVNPALGDGELSGWGEAIDLRQYTQMVRAAQEYIRSGDIYQANLARTFVREVRDLDAWAFFKILWSLTASPLAAYCIGADRTLLSASPELFLAIRDGRVVTKPIKGTKPRGANDEEDRRNEASLLASPKERAELVMITDLERNDLGQICEYGSVKADELLVCEKLSHVFHLVSTVEGKLREGISQVQALRACFPGGSITGAPKKRAMEIIDELEPFERGFFTGAIGYFGYDGSAQFNIAIRTAEWRDNCLSFMTGSGITSGSDANDEFAETEHKARALKEAFALYQRKVKARN